MLAPITTGTNASATISRPKPLVNEDDTGVQRWIFVPGSFMSRPEAAKPGPCDPIAA